MKIKKIFSMMALFIVSIVLGGIGVVNAALPSSAVVLDLTYYNEVELDLNNTSDPLVTAIGGLVDTTKATSFWTFDDSTSELKQGMLGDKIKVTYDSTTNKAKVVLNIEEPQDGAVAKDFYYDENTITIKYGYIVQELSDIYIDDAQTINTLYDGLVPKIAGEEGSIFTAVSTEPDKYYVYLERWSSDDGKTFTSAEFFNNDAHTNGGEDLITAFEYGKKYYYSIWIKPKEGYKFTSNVKIHSNNYYLDERVYDPSVDGDNDKTGVTFKLTYYFEAFRLVKSIEIKGFNTPIVGQIIPSALSIKLYGMDNEEISKNDYTINYLKWYIIDENGDRQAVELPNVFELGKKYVVEIILEIGNEYLYADDYIIECENLDDNHIDRHGKWLQILSKEMTAVEASETVIYEITEGANQSYTLGSNKKLIFKANGEYIKCIGYEIDGIFTATEYNPIYKGIAILTLEPDYLETLSVGTHTLKMVFADGKASSTFNIVLYEILEGANQSYTIDSNKELTIRANGEFSKFIGIEVDGISVSSDKYTAASGSTIVTLKSEYLNTLSVGTHTMKFLYNDGDVSTNFTIVAKETTAETPSNPNTLDNISLYTTLGSISLIGLTSIGLYLRKRMN